MAEFHRKIELQSPDDLQYLVSNIRRAAEAEIEKNLPTIEGQALDPMRLKVEELVKAYLDTVFSTTAENVSINGMDATSNTIMLQKILSSDATSTHSIEEHEPFNTKLFVKAKELAQQEEDLIEEIAKLRREVPVKIVEGTKERFSKARDADEELLGKIGEGQRGKGVELKSLERQEQMQTSWENGISGLERMVKGMPESVAKSERAQRAEAYVVGGGKK